MNSQAPEPLLIEAKEISKGFSGIPILKKVNFKIRGGKVNAIVGENGAGKSTLMNIISGVYADYEGDLLLDGQKVVFESTTAARNAGVSIIHQELQLVPNLSIAENIFLGREPLNALGLVDYKKMREEAQSLLRGLELNVDVNSKIATLRVGQQQIVEIAKALSFDVRLLIMDEPTSALSESETTVLFKLIRSLTQKGVAIVYITHKMDELTQLADYVTVFRDGCSVNEAPVKNITVDDVVKLMVGREPKDFFQKNRHPLGPSRLRVNGLSLNKANKCVLKDITFEVNTCEVVGIYGLMGAGRTELFEALFGLHSSNVTGQIVVENKQIAIDRPIDAIKAGIALIPEDRKNDGLVLGMDIAQNISLPTIYKILKGSFLSRGKEETQANEYRTKLNIKSHSASQTASKLSGGNQQKIVLSKWLLTNPKILLLDEPTRGIDINAKNEIYKLIDDLASKGMSILVVSSELPEIMAVSDRILTLCEGKLTGEFQRDEFSQERILKSALPKRNEV